ncbi:MAG: N-acetylmuramoyl-L-alanine amidase [Candidatus Xenobiia bacterium LiM19]
MIKKSIFICFIAIVLLSMSLPVSADSTAEVKGEVSSSGALQFRLPGRSFNISSLWLRGGDIMTPLREEQLRSRAGMSVDESLKGLYIALDSPDANRFLTAIGAFSSWSSSRETLLIFSQGRNIYFDRQAGWCTWRGQETRLPQGLMNVGSTTYIPLPDLLKLMKVSIEKEEKKLSYTLIPVIDDLYWKEDLGTREFLIHVTCPVRYKIERTDEKSISILFSDAESVLKDGDYTMVDAQVKVENNAGGSRNTRITMQYPDYWEGRLTALRMTGDIVIEMLPRFPLVPGYRYEQVQSYEIKPQKKGFSYQIGATGPLQYLWSYNAESRLLIVDIPLLEIPGDKKPPALNDPLISAYNAFFLNKSYGDTRLYFTLAPETGFSFVTDKAAPHILRLDFIPGSKAAEKSGRGVTGESENWGTIVLDPGHGGCDPGAVNNSLQLLEKEVNLDVCLRLARLLQQSGWKVVLTRISDRDVSWANSPDKVELQARVDVGAANSATVFVSVHCNASTDPYFRGSSLHWCKSEDYPLATAVVLSTSLFEEKLGIPQRGLFQNNFYVINHSTMPSLLIEMAHISCMEEAQIFANPSCRQILAESIAKGLEKYFLEKGFKKRTQ